MTEEIRRYRLEQLVLALVVSRISMHWLIESGFTSGQIMRALLDAQEAELIVDEGGKTVLTDSGAKALNALRMAKPKERWILPMYEKRIPAIDVTDVWLPDEYDILD